jgi:O-antigen/teichoic acid export membrane protein
MVLSLIALKLNFINFGENLFGIWIALSALWGLGNVLDLGLGVSLIKFISEKLNKDKEDLSYLVSSGFFAFLLIGIIIFIVIVSIFYLFYFTNSDLVPVVLRGTIQEFFIILGAAFLLKYLTIFFRAVFEGHSNFVLTSIITIIYNFLIFFSVLLVYFFNLDIVKLSIGYLISALIFIGMFVFQFIYRFSNINISVRFFRISELKKIISLSVSIQGARILGALIDPVIKYSLGNFFYLELVSYYEIARRFTQGITNLYHTTFRNYLPKASSLESTQKYKEFVLQEVTKVAKLSVTYSGFIYGICGILITILIQQLYGYDEAILIFFILALPEIINCFGYPIYLFFIGIGKVQYIIFTQSLNLIIISIFMFVGPYVINSSLILFGYFFSNLIANYFFIYFLKNKYNISAGKFLTISNLNKLILLFALIILEVIFLSVFNTYITLSILLLSILSLAIFGKDILSLAKLIKLEITTK